MLAGTKPFTLEIQFGMKIIQHEGRSRSAYLSDHQVRHVRMNVPHSPHPTPSWQGESVGYYDGDTLVMDMIGQKVGPLSMVDSYGTPFSSALHVVERYRLIDGELARDLQRKHESNYFPAGSRSRMHRDRAISILTPRSRDCRLRSLSRIRRLSPRRGQGSQHIVMCWASGPKRYVPRTRRGPAAHGRSSVPQSEKPDF